MILLKRARCPSCTLFEADEKSLQLGMAPHRGKTEAALSQGISTLFCTAANSQNTQPWNAGSGETEDQSPEFCRDL